MATNGPDVDPTGEDTLKPIKSTADFDGLQALWILLTAMLVVIIFIQV